MPKYQYSHLCKNYNYLFSDPHHQSDLIDKIFNSKDTKKEATWPHSVPSVPWGPWPLAQPKTRWGSRKLWRPCPSCPPSPICTERLPPTQVNRYFGPKLSFAPNFRNSVSVHSLPNKNSRKLTLADGPQECAHGGYLEFISKRGPRAKRQTATSLSTGLLWEGLAGPSFYEFFLFFLPQGP